MNENSPIFHDPAGKRWPIFKRIGIYTALCCSVLGALLCVTILFLPTSRLAGAYRDDLTTFTIKPSRAEAVGQYLLKHSPDKLKAHMQAKRATRDIRRQRKQHIRADGKPNQTVIGFYVNWDSNSFNSFRDHIDALTYVMPEWLSLPTTNDEHPFIDRFSARTRDPEMVKLAKAHDLPIIPILNNADEEDFRWEPLRRLLSDESRQRALAVALRDHLLMHGYAGINLDFEPPYENMSHAEMVEAHALLPTAFPHFVKILKQTFAPANLLVTQDLPVALREDQPDLEKDNFNYEQLADLNDLVILMQYDEHADTDPPGPIASQPWLEDTADELFAQMDSSKVILGIGNYCYDWPADIDAAGNIHGKGRGQELLLGAALTKARDAHATIQMDDDELNPYFGYRDPATGQSHVVYMLDAVTAYNHIKALKGYEPRGAALW
ncbi:MAG TPA: glycosyl hydrolase family 18 protein, partial [Armatimonadota bacterium]